MINRDALLGELEEWIEGTPLPDDATMSHARALGGAKGRALLHLGQLRAALLNLDHVVAGRRDGERG
jgi:hypothetical protein